MVTPPWSGSSLREYLERTGVPAIEALDYWVTELRFPAPLSSFSTWTLVSFNH